MYISVREWMLADTFGSIKAALDAMGINAVELEYFRDKTVSSLESNSGSISLAGDAEIDDFEKKIKNAGIRVSALLMHNNFGADDVDFEVNWTISCFKTAARLGIKAVRIDAIMSTEKDWPIEKRVDVFAECMARVLDATGNLDVQMGIENHGIQGNQPEFLTHVIEKVGSPRLGMTIDTANFYWYGHPLSKVYDIIKQLAPKVKHTHIKNINYPADVREVQREIGWKYNDYVCPLREGDIDLKAVVSILKDAGYEGDLCIEDESLMRWDNEKRKAVLIDDAAYLKEILS